MSSGISVFINFHADCRDLSGYGNQLAEIAPGTFSQASFVTNL